MYEKGSILSGPSWSEPVEVVSFATEPGVGYYAELIGRQSQKFYQEYVFETDLDQITLLQTSTTVVLQKDEEQHFLAELIQFQQQQNIMKKNQQILPLPHQIEAVYRRMLKAPTIRYLLADDPGAGKTIMSGMLIQELLLRNLTKKVLILVPPLVMKQWQDELATKFDLHFQIINRQTFEVTSNNPFSDVNFTISSMYWAAREDVKPHILVNNYDLVIIDEAHKLAAYLGKKGQGKKKTNLYKLAEALAKQTEHFVLLTATPHKGDRHNYRFLLQLLDEDLFFNKGLSDYDLVRFAQPFIIRRLKESMVRFDGTPLFPKRTTKTIQFELSHDELILYEKVTTYISEHFNRAKANGMFAIQFAMMLLQRRLSSSFAALHASLQRRYERLGYIEKAQQKFELEMMENPEEFDLIDEEILGVSDTYDLQELAIEREALRVLLDEAQNLQLQGHERKYLALEQALFAEDGLLAQNEKLLIFTESADTLFYLQTQLETKVGKVALIHGKMNLAQRQQAVETFRNDVSIMIATDAGGESINLQFCNQMINYDIPWNPNRLEQRMGRIHRIGQLNEVFVFNLVAHNTREGNVLQKLLEKLEIMQSDLGSDLVYNFLGELLEKKDLDLNQLMIEAIQNREQLTTVLKEVDTILSQEHKLLLEQAQNEQFAENIALPSVKEEFEIAQVQSLPATTYCQFIKTELELLGIDVTQPEAYKLRIHYIPKSVHTQAKEWQITLPKKEVIELDFKLQQQDYRNDQQQLILKLVEQVVHQRAVCSKLQTYQVALPCPEPITAQIIQYQFVDGNERTLSNRQTIIGQRENGTFFEISPLFFYPKQLKFSNWQDEQAITALTKESKFKIIKEFQAFQTQQAFKVQEKINQLEEAFDTRIELAKKQLNKFDASNTINIMKYQSKIREDERRRANRIVSLQREAKVKLQKITPLTTLAIVPEVSWRVIPDDVKYLIEFYEEENNRFKCRQLPAFGLVDFQTKTSDGEIRYIIVARERPTEIENLADYVDISAQTFIYIVDDYTVKEEVPLGYYNV